MPSLIGALRISLGLETAAFEKGGKRAAAEVDVLGTRMEKAGFKIGQFAKLAAGGIAAFAGSAVVQSIKQAAMEGLEFASSLGEQAQQLGVTTSALQFYRYAATQVGVEQEAMDKGLGKLTIKLGQLATGTDKQRESLTKYGFTQAEIARLSKSTAEEALPLIAERMKAIQSPTEQAALAAEFFGAKLGGKFITLLADGAAGVDALAKAYKDLGIEMSPEQIAKADAAMDHMAQTTLVLKAKQAELAADNAPTIVKFTEAWETAKIKLMEFAVWYGENFVGRLVSAHDTIIARATGAVIEWAEAWGRNLKMAWQAVETFGGKVRDFAVQVPGWIGEMVGKIQTWVTTKLNQIWDAAGKKITEVKGWFFGLYDAVVGHSYIPDMVDGIAAQMARLDTVMVDPAHAATKKTAEAFKALAAEVQPLLDRLFPEAAAANAFGKDFATIEAARGAGMLDRGQAAAALERLQNQYLNDNAAERENPLADQAANESLVNLKALDAQLQQFAGTLAATVPQITPFNALFAEVGEGLGEMRRDVARSFTDVVLHSKNLGEGVLNAFDRFASRLLDQVFDDLLGGVFGGGGGGLLAGVGKIFGFADGTMSAPGGLALVGERGPELVNLPGRSQVWNEQMLSGAGGGGNVYHISGNLLTPEFWAQIQRMDAASAQQGSKMAIRDLGYRQSRSLARG